MSDDADGLGKVVCRAFGNAGVAGGSPILDAGLQVIAGMRSTTGRSRPDVGDSFGAGAAGFAGVECAVTSAQPGGAWEGAGALAYASATRRQARAVESLAVLDRGVHTVVAREADQITASRGALEEHADRLVSVGRATASMVLVSGVGAATKAALELSAVNTALGAGVAELEGLASEADANAAQLRRLAAAYAEVADSEVTGSDDPPTTSDAVDEEYDDRVQQLSADRAADPVLSGAPSPYPLQPYPQPPYPPPQSASDSAAPVPASGDPMSGLSTAFGTVGGMIGSVVAPLTAVLTGVVAAAAQSLSSVTPAESAAADVDVEPPTDDDEPRREPTETAVAQQHPGSAPAVDAPVDAPVVQPAPVPPPPVAPPAATRPPQQ